MITYENTKTIYDLVEHAGRDYDNRVFLRYEENDMVFDISYRHVPPDHKSFLCSRK